MTDCPTPPAWVRWMETAEPLKPNGVFVDVGAGDGKGGSNSLYLEQCIGWTGVCVEEDKQLFKELTTNRPEWTTIKHCCKLSPHEREESATGAAASLEDGSPAPARKRRLGTLLFLSYIEHVDVLLVNAKHRLLDVLQSVDWQYVTIDAMLVCTEAASQEQKREAEVFLQTLYYRPAARFGEYTLYRQTPLGLFSGYH